MIRAITSDVAPKRYFMSNNLLIRAAEPLIL